MENHLVWFKMFHLYPLIVNPLFILMWIGALQICLVHWNYHSNPIGIILKRYWLGYSFSCFNHTDTWYVYIYMILYTSLSYLKWFNDETCYASVSSCVYSPMWNKQPVTLRSHSFGRRASLSNTQPWGWLTSSTVVGRLISRKLHSGKET